jgi:hypothetical protein
LGMWVNTGDLQRTAWKTGGQSGARWDKQPTKEKHSKAGECCADGDWEEGSEDPGIWQCGVLVNAHLVGR